MVLIHGWGKTADSAWWPIIAGCERTMVVLDLPGHGRSHLSESFTFALAAEAVELVILDSAVERPVLVAHSMGGPAAFTAIRRSGAEAYSGLVALATSAYWVRPKLWLMMAMAPYAMARGSPFLIHTARTELRDTDHMPEHIAWSYTRRPVRRLLDETASELRRFDAREWTDLSLPPTTWVVTTEDSVLSPEHQHASAEHFGAEVIEVEAQHSLVVQRPCARSSNGPESHQGTGLVARGAADNYSPNQTGDHTVSSLPLGSQKWKRRPPGKSYAGVAIDPPAEVTAASVASRSSE